MHEEKVAVEVLRRQFAEKVPTAIHAAGASPLELLTRPVNRSLRHRIETFGIEQGGLIVIAQYDDGQPHHSVETFAGVGAITDDVPQAVDLANSLVANVLLHGLEGFEIGVDVANQGPFHESPFPYAKGGGFADAAIARRGEQIIRRVYSRLGTASNGHAERSGRPPDASSPCGAGMAGQPQWTIRRLLDWTADFLAKHGSESSRLDAQVLLSDVLGCDKLELFLRYDEEPTEEARTRFRELVRRRSQGEPVAYLVGHREFFSLRFEVGPEVLIPRPETEHLVIATLDRARTLSAPRIADVGTGSGAIAVAVAHQGPECRVTAIDISAAALGIARRNAALHGVAERIEFREGNLLAEFPEQPSFDIVASNPPYVRSDEWANLPAGIRDHEPRTALDGGADGCDLIRRLAPQAVQRLKPGGWLLLEIGPTSVKAAEEALRGTTGLGEIAIEKDLARLPRVLIARRLPEAP